MFTGITYDCQWSSVSLRTAAYESLVDACAAVVRAYDLVGGLRVTIRNAHLEIVLLLLQDLDMSHVSGACLLHDAVAHAPIVAHLLDRCCDVHEQDSEQETALHRASRGGHLDTARLLLERGAERVCNKDDICPIGLSSSCEMLELLLRTWKPQGQYYFSVLTVACQLGCLGRVKDIVNSFARAKARGESWTADHHLAKLLSTPLDEEWGDNPSDGYLYWEDSWPRRYRSPGTLLEAAVQSGNCDLIAFLLDQGVVAEPSAALLLHVLSGPHVGEHRGLARRGVAYVRGLLESGSSDEGRAPEGWRGVLSVVRALISHGLLPAPLDPETIEELGDNLDAVVLALAATPPSVAAPAARGALFAICRRCSWWVDMTPVWTRQELLEFLVEAAGGNIDARDPNGWTALGLAVQASTDARSASEVERVLETIDVLLNLGAPGGVDEGSMITQRASSPAPTQARTVARLSRTSPSC